MSLFPIRVLSEQTGVPATTLRAWERRYGLLKPARTPKGHRVYNQADLDTVRRVVQLLETGSTIGKAANIVKSGASARPERQQQISHWALYRKRCLQSIEAFNDRRLDTVYNEALAIYPIDIVTAQMLLPVLQQLGKEWPQRANGVAEEHFYSAWLRNKVGARMHHEAGRTRGRRLLMACLPGEHHELGILLFGLSAMAHGYRILYLGPDLPLQQVAGAAARAGVAAVLLSGSSQRLASSLQRDILQLAADLEVPLLLGGKVSEELQNMRQTGQLALLGTDYSAALERLDACVPPFGSAS